MSVERDDGFEHEGRDGLFSALSAGDWETGKPADLARRAAACVRRRVRRRRCLIACGSAAALALAVSVVRLGLDEKMGEGEGAGAGREHAVRLVAAVAGPSMPKALMPGQAHPFELSDEEALELLRGRPLMVTRRPDGSLEIVLLDRAETTSVTASPARF